MTHRTPKTLPADQARCKPSGQCAARDKCARFLSPLPQTGAVLMDGYAEAQSMMPIKVIASCRHFLSQAVLNAHQPAPERKAKPWVGASCDSGEEA